MSGSIFGRVQHSRAAPIAIPPQVITPAITDTVCYCGLGPQADDGNPFDGNPVGANYTACEGVSDMRAKVTVIGWDDDFTDLAIRVRETVGGGDYYEFRVDPSGPGVGPNPYPDADYSLVVSGVTVAGPTNLPHPVAGDVLQLSAVGTAIVASVNGTPLFSITDSSFAPTAFNRMRVTGTSTSAVASYNVTWEDFCP